MKKSENRKLFRETSQNIVKSSLGWLILLSAATVAAAAAMGMLRLGVAADSASYVQASGKNLLGMLGDVRSFGYPLFLKCVALVSPHFALLPYLHIAFHVAVAFFLYGALRRYGAPGWQSLALAGGFLLTLLNDPSSQCIMTDFLGRAVGVGVLASLFWVSSRRPARFSWVALGIFLFAAWAVRPADIVWVVLVPPAGVLLYLLGNRGDKKPAGGVRPFAVRVTAIAILPLAAFCSTRLLLVNDFGVVSFAGYQESGLAAGLLNESVVENDVPKYLQPLARGILQERKRRGMACVIQPNGVDVARWKKEFSINAWEIAAPVADGLYHQNTVLANKRLGELSRVILKRHLKLYLLFALTNFWESLGGVLRFGLVLQALSAVAILLYCARLFVGAWFGAIRSRPRSDSEQEIRKRCVRNGFSLIALTYCCLSVVLVGLTTVNMGRYSIAAGILLPSLAAEWAFREAITLRDYFRWAATAR